jgi:hypothetical protein
MIHIKPKNMAEGLALRHIFGINYFVQVPTISEGLDRQSLMVYSDSCFEALLDLAHAIRLSDIFL